MNRLDFAQLQRCDVAAWTVLLRREMEMDGVTVTAVSSDPLPPYHHLNRYTLTLAEQSDPVTFVGKHTNRTEVIFYQETAAELPGLAAPCLFSHWSGEKGWVLLPDVPNHVKAEKWLAQDVETAVHGLATLHATFWNRAATLQKVGFNHFVGGRRNGWGATPQDPLGIPSEHALRYAGEMGPTFHKAAQGIHTLRDLGGWPGVLQDVHLEAASDLLDDPAPMLETLLNLPVTLLHGDPHTRHWRLTLFDDVYLLDWHRATIGPAVCDLVNFLEQFDWFYEGEQWGQLEIRQKRPMSDETIIDSYLLAMSYELDSLFPARAVRQAIAAARCLYVLTNWLPQFATLFSTTPSRQTWQQVNQMSDEQLATTSYKPLVLFRPYLAGIFRRFLSAYKTL